MSLDKLCDLFGRTRQGLWKQGHTAAVEAMEDDAIIAEVRLIRAKLPRAGVRKVWVKLMEMGIHVGRDRLFSIMREAGMLVKPLRSYTITTRTYEWLKKWPNLIKGLTPTAPDMIWVADITYVEVYVNGVRRFMYLSLITDTFTHEIVGYCLHPTLDTQGPLRALHRALEGCDPTTLAGLIHHSDRGCQYCSAEYVTELQRHGILVSMTEGGDPYENAVAERVNGILKNEWLYHERLTSVEQATARIDEIVDLYNNYRPHMSIGNITPAAAREAGCAPPPLWKNYRRREHPEGVVAADRERSMTDGVDLPQLQRFSECYCVPDDDSEVVQPLPITEESVP